MSRSVGIVVAAGSGSRMGTQVPKQFLEVCGLPAYLHSLLAFEESPVDGIVLVTGKDSCERCFREARAAGVRKLEKAVAGGAQRYDSVYAGLLACDCADGDIVLIHDGARLLVSPGLIRACIEAAEECGACAPAVPLADTVRYIDEEGRGADTPDRGRLRAMQTPQAFRYGIIRRAYDAFFADPEGRSGERVTDDVMIAQKYAGARSRLIPGEYANRKLTTAEDLDIVTCLLEKRRNRAAAAAPDTER